MQNETKMENGMRISDLWKVLKRAILFMVLAAVVCGTAAGAITEFMVQKLYAVTIEFKVTAVDNTGNSAQNLSVAIVDDFVGLICKSEELAKAVLAEMTTTNDKGEEVKVAQSRENIAVLQNSISVKTTEKSSIFAVTLTNANPDYAYNMAVAMGDVVPEYFAKTQQQIMGTNGTQKGEVMVVRSAQMYDAESPSPVYPNVPRNIVLFALVGAVVCYLIFLLIYMMDTTIRTEEELKQVLDCPVLGVIPAITPEAPTTTKPAEVK